MDEGARGLWGRRPVIVIGPMIPNLRDYSRDYAGEAAGVT